MNEQEFWDLVHSIGWGTKTTDCNEVSKKLLRELSTAQMEGMRERFSICRGELIELVEPTIENVSDDGLCDLTAHIVGLGREEYEFCLNNPSAIQDRANSGDYVESFSYCIPHPDDLQCLDVEHYRKWAIAERKVFSPVDDPHLEDIQGDLQTICEALEVMEDGDWQHFLTHEKTVKKALDNLKKHFESLDESMAALGYLPNPDMSNNIRNPNGVLNLFHDIKNYLQSDT
jgi:hypothetical protein